MNTYDVTGRKLRAEYHKGGEQDTLRTDYCGNLIYELGKPYMLLVDGGYVTFNDNDSLSFGDGFGKVTRVIDGNEAYQMDITYGPDQQRWKSVLTKMGQPVRTTIYADDYEEVISADSTTRRFHYLDGGAVVVSQDGEDDAVYYAFTDNLGSVLRLVNSHGETAFEASYDAWGRQTVTTDSIGFRRGYTGHEMLPEFGLINMNGRMYDPVIGRFISPDNYVQLPDFSQSYNRYSYCLNNPLKYTDPSGELFGIDDLIVAGASFAAGYVSNGLSTGHWGMSSIVTGVSTAVIGWLGYNMPGVSHSIANALATSGNIAANSVITSVMPSVTVPISSYFYLSVSPMVGYSAGNISIAMGCSLGYSTGNFSMQLGAGFGENYMGWNITASIEGWGAGYGKTYYEEGKFYGQNIAKQTTGTLIAIFPNVTFTISNDLWGDKLDRWRSSAVELTIGNVSIGTYVSTNWGLKESNGVRHDEPAPLLGKNPDKNNKGKAWANGKVFESPLWFGIRQGNTIHRLGYSHRYVQTLTQNFVHRNIAKTPYFIDYNSFHKGIYVYSGYANPFTLWNN